MALSISPGNLARASARHPWRVVAIWIAVFVVSMMLVGSSLSGALTTEAKATNNPDSTVGENLLEQRLRGPFRAQEAVIITSDTLTVDDQAFQDKVGALLGEIRGLGPDVVQSATSYYETNAPSFVSTDKHSTFIAVTMAGKIDDANENVADIIDMVQAQDGQQGFSLNISGLATANHDFTTAAEKDLSRSEYGPLPLALLILILVFGAVVAAFVPVVLAFFAIFGALALVALLGFGFQFSFFVQNMIMMMGLAVGIDYSLFILSRYREELAKGISKVDAITNAGGTAGRAVLFSGMTVVIALLGLLIIPHTIFRSLSVGAILVVTVSVMASLTLLPAVLSLLGGWVNRGRIPFVQHAQQTHDEQAVGGFWDKVARGVMAKPVLSVVLSAGVLIALSIPFFSINLGGSGVSTLPESFIAKQGFDVLEAKFNGGDVNPVEVVIDGDVNSPAVQSAIDNLKAAAANEPDLGAAAFEANDAGDLGLLTFQLSADSFSDEAVATVKHLRNEYIPAAFAGTGANVYVTGQAAISADQYALTDTYTPILFVFVLGLSFILLTMVFRSIVVPAKAILLNLLSVGAAYGLLVLVFQDGFLHNLLGFQKVEAIESWLPLLLFAILFGLSMDYHVFLLSRIRERYDLTHNNTESVAFGVRSTGRLITGAALIMVTVFGGFAIGDLVMMQQMGFGLGISVLIDATLIRSVLVPASMKMLGDWNWYLPPVLNWLPHLGIEGAPASQPEGVSAGGGS